MTRVCDWFTVLSVERVSKPAVPWDNQSQRRHQPVVQHTSPSSYTSTQTMQLMWHIAHALVFLPSSLLSIIRSHPMMGLDNEQSPCSSIFCTSLLLSAYYCVDQWGVCLEWGTNDLHIRTRGNRHRLLQKHCHYNLRKLNFSNRVIPVWNSLPDYVVCTETFTNRLDKHWSDEEVLYDYNADLHGIGNRSIMLKDSSS